MTDTYASTCAVVIPVLALAGVIELRSAFTFVAPGVRLWRHYWYMRMSYLVTFATVIAVCATWGVLMGYSVWSEDACLNYMLTHQQANGDAAATPVKLTLVWLLIMLVLFPILGMIFNLTSADSETVRKGHEALRIRAERKRAAKTAARQPSEDPSIYLG